MGKIVKAEKHDKKSLLECYKCNTLLYQENSWFLAWSEEANAIAQAYCKNCLMELFVK